MSRPLKGRVDKLAPDKISTEQVIDELKSKIQLAEYERKAAFEKSEDEKKKNFATLLSERRRNKFHLKEQKLSPDSHNIAHAYDKKQPAEKLFVVKKTMGEAIKIQDQKVCESIKKYNLQVHLKQQKMEQVRKLTEELQLANAQKEKLKQEELSSPETQNIRLLENKVEKLKMKLNSAQLISKTYRKILDTLKEETQSYPWKIDELEIELKAHKKELENAIQINQDSKAMAEKTGQDTKRFHEEFFESKKNRDKLLGKMRKEVDKAHKELKGSEKPKLGRNNNTPNPMQEMVSKEADEAYSMQQKYEQQRKKRVDYETKSSFLKNACKVSTKEEILPAIVQQNKVQKALELQISNLEDQKALLEIEKQGVSKEYQKIKYFSEKRVSEGTKKIDQVTQEVEDKKQQLSSTNKSIKEKEDLLHDVDIALENLFTILQKYKIDSRAKQAMTGDYEVDIQMLTEKLELLCKQIEPHGKVVDFLENPEFLDFMEDTLPKANTRVDIRGEEEEGTAYQSRDLISTMLHTDVFEEDSSKTASNILSREEMKKASQRIVEKNQGKVRRKKK